MCSKMDKNMDNFPRNLIVLAWNRDAAAEKQSSGHPRLVGNVTSHHEILDEN